MQIETINTFKNYWFIVTFGFFAQNKVEKICLISWGVFNKTIIIPLALFGYEMIIANSALCASWLSIISYPTHARGIIIIIVKYTGLVYSVCETFIQINNRCGDTRN